MWAVKSPESARKLMTSVLPAITLSMPGIKLRMRELATYGTGTGMLTPGLIMVRQEADLLSESTIEQKRCNSFQH